MCNILAISSKEPFTINRYLNYYTEFLKTAKHNKDGWGLGITEGKECLVIKEPIDIRTSNIFRSVEKYSPLQTNHLLFHIRDKSKWGTIHITNTHPFLYTFKTERWVFMHNGNINPPEQKQIPQTEFIPLGNTDSEKIFCALLPLLETHQSPKLIHSLLCNLTKLGSVNVIFTNGKTMFVFRGNLERTLYYYQTTKEIIFSKYPLIHDSWQEILPKTLLIVKDGKIIHKLISK